MRSPPHRTWAWVGVAALIGLGVVVFAYTYARTAAIDAARTQGAQRMSLYATTIRAAIDRFSSLPSILAMDPEIHRLLIHRSPAAVSAANERLERINIAARSANLYVMAPDGTTIAASNWQSTRSYVGQNYGFRPYFSEARTQGAGRFFGVGLTTREPGYFLAAGIFDEGGAFLGAVVVKIDLDRLEHDWAAVGEQVYVTDHNGVAILSSVPAWHYTVAAPIDEALAARLAVGQRYGDRTIREMTRVTLDPLDGGARLVAIDGRRYLAQSQTVPGESWQIHYLVAWNGILATARGSALMAGSGWAAAVLFLLYLRQRRLGIRARVEAQAAVEAALRQARDDLERTVAARTAALRAEVAEREKTERHLRATQDELIHAGKMAALGQMAAIMAHEINHPLAALRTVLAGARICADRGDGGPDTAQFTLMEDLAERIARITLHLKVFARKGPISLQHVDLSQTINRALFLLDGQIRAAGVTVETSFLPVLLSGDPLRLEQVFINLIRNALDAMADSSDRRMTITVERDSGWCVIRFADSGPGIDENVLEHMFDPFFTTKPAGEGLGLGLSLSYGIIRDMGGSIAAGSADGAMITIHLPIPGHDGPTA